MAKRKLIKYAMQVAPNKAKIPGVRAKYKLNGNDQIKATNMNEFLDFNEE